MYSLVYKPTLHSIAQILHFVVFLARNDACALQTVAHSRGIQGLHNSGLKGYLNMGVYWL